MTERNIALVGIGKIARDQHIPSIAASDAWHLAATASRNAGVDGVEGFASLAGLLAARPDIPCISLCTPPHVRYADARAALEAGRHVMLEKPPGATLSEVHDLTALAEAAGVTLFATWHSRFAKAVPAAKAWLAGKDITEVEITWKEDVRRWHPGQDWIWEAGGLGVFDPGINALSVLTEVFPRAVHVNQAVLEFPQNRDTPIAVTLGFHDPGGAQVKAVFDWRQEGPQTWDIRLETRQGSALLSSGGDVFTRDATTQQDQGEALPDAPSGEYPGLYARFAELVESGASEVDLTPMRHVADAFTLGRRISVDAFHW
ncbi:MAG: Gfo/Idh/MocA family oxidoreductase [Pseudomonadota bacterium]